MKIAQLKNAREVFRSEDSTGQLVTETSQADVVLLTLEPGALIPEHALEIPVLFTMASGSATLLASGQCHPLTAGDVVQVDPGELRGWKNESPSVCRIFAIKQMR